jgi:hypothetical protein
MRNKPAGFSCFSLETTFNVVLYPGACIEQYPLDFVTNKKPTKLADMTQAFAVVGY